MTAPSENLLNELRATLGKLEIALGSIHDAILWTDEMGTVQWCNAGFDRLSGQSHIEILGANFRDILPLKVSPPGTDPVAAILNAVRDETPYYDFDKDGRRLILEITGSIFHVADGPKSVILVIRDVTADKDNETLIKKKSEELARSNEELQQFALVASHDLQEPLRMVQAFTDRLKKHLEGSLDEQGAKYMNYVTDGAIRMRTLIQDLLAYSRAGRGELNRVPTDFNELVNEAAEPLAEDFEKTGMKLIREPLPKLTVSPVLMRQVFQNLFANALKFRGPDQPTLRVFSRQGDGGWTISVQDNGIGLDPKYRFKVFEIFQRLHSIAQYPGTGIGLAICKKIVERHGGRIWVESEEGEGATFSFFLPDVQSTQGDDA